MSNRVSLRFFFCLALVVSLSVVVVQTHNYVGLEHGGVVVRARVQSPNAQLTDLPTPINGTNLSIVCFRVRNTGQFDSRITAVGLEVAGDATGYSLVSTTDPAFSLIEQVTNVPQLPDVTLDFALVTGHTFGGGRPNVGLAPGGSLTTFCVSGPFQPDLPIERLLDRGVVRVQRVGPNGADGDVAVWESRPQ